MSSLFQAVDFQSPPGLQLKAKLEARYVELNEELQSISLGEARTQQVRGGLALIKEMLAQPAKFVPSPRYGSINRFPGGK